MKHHVMRNSGIKLLRSFSLAQIMYKSSGKISPLTYIGSGPKGVSTTIIISTIKACLFVDCLPLMTYDLKLSLEARI